jgi:hypothetical protein
MNTAKQAVENMEYVRGLRDPVHEWRVARLMRLGIPWPVAEAAAGHVDWHQMAALVQRGCPPWLALRILR